MSVRKDLEELLEKLKVERDEINLKLHLASMEAREEFEGAEKQWQQLKAKASEIADDTREASDEFITRAKIVAEELKDTYHRINKRLSK